MVRAEQETMRELGRIQEQLFFVLSGLEASGNRAIMNGDGTLDARIVTGAADTLRDIAERLNNCIDG